MKLVGVGVINRALKISMGNANASFNCSICCICDNPSSNNCHNLNKEVCQQKGGCGGCIENGVKRDDDLFHCFRYFLRFGKVFGVIPFDGVFTGRLGDLQLRWTSPGTLYSILIMLLMFLNMIIGFLGLMHIGGSNATDWAWSAESFVFYSMAFFIHTYFITCGRKLISVFYKWTTLNLEFSEVDRKLAQDTNLFFGVIFTSAIFENILLQIIFFFIPIDDQSRAKHPLERYYDKAQTHWALFINYNEIWAILIFFCNKLALYAWNFVDVLIIVMSRAIYHKFKTLHQVGKERLLGRREDFVLEIDSIYDNNEQSIQMWEKLVKEYDSLGCLLKSFEDFLSPLIFASYAINCFYTCLQLHLGLSAYDTEDSTSAHRAYAIWSFIHLLFRMFLVSITSAKINDHIKNFLELLYLCPQRCDSRLIERTRFKIASSTTLSGLSGLRCFVITRPFILKVISVIFTIEIVLLQAPGPDFCRNGTVAGRSVFVG